MRILREAALGVGCILILATIGRANDPSDYEAVESAVAALNNPAIRPLLFANGVDGRLLLEGLLEVPATSGPGQASPYSEGDSATVVRVPGLGLELQVSHEPLGEAQIMPSRSLVPIAAVGSGFFGVEGNPRAGIRSPRIASRHVRFVTADVALVDAVIENPMSGFANLQSVGGERVSERATSARLVLIMVKEEGSWRVAVARLTK